MRATFASSDVLYRGSELILTSNVPAAVFMIRAPRCLPAISPGHACMTRIVTNGRVHVQSAGPFDRRQRLTVDDADFEGERIEAFDATEVDAVTVHIVFAVADVGKNPAALAEVVVQYFLVPQVHAQVMRVRMRREVRGRNIGR